MIRQQPQPLLAFAPRFLRRFQFRHVNMGSDESQRPPIRTALDLGLRGNPPDLAVARPDDPVLANIVCRRARKGVEEMALGTLAVLWVNAVYPILVRLMHRFRRKPVDAEVFRRAPVVKAIAKST